MTISVLIPWRTDHGARERIFNHVHAAWTATGWQVCVGQDEHTGPINVSRLLNLARAQATGRILVIAAADHLPNPAAVENGAAAAAEHGWAALFDSTAELTERATVNYLGGQAVALDESNFGGLWLYCTALLAVRNDVWDAVGGMDERFTGWGCEDVAFRYTLNALYPTSPPPVGHRSISLWHPPSDKTHLGANIELLRGYTDAHNAGGPDGLRAHLASR